MTGREVLAQVREALCMSPTVQRSTYSSVEAALAGESPLRVETLPEGTWRQGVLAALDGCVLLTREEAEEILLLMASVYWGEGEPHARAYALLTPEDGA